MVYWRYYKVCRCIVCYNLFMNCYRYRRLFRYWFFYNRFLYTAYC